MDLSSKNSILIYLKKSFMKKVVISPTDTKAIAFFEKILKKKEELRKKIESKLAKTASLTKGTVTLSDE